MDWTPFKNLLAHLENSRSLTVGDLESCVLRELREIYLASLSSADLDGISDDDAWQLNLNEPIFQGVLVTYNWSFNRFPIFKEKIIGLCQARSGLEVLILATPEFAHQQILEQIRQLDVTIDDRFLSRASEETKASRLEGKPPGHFWWAAVPDEDRIDDPSDEWGVST